MPALETGIQFHLPTYAHVPLPHLVELATRAEAKGVDQFWVTDNLRSRQSFVVLAAMASRLKAKLGTAVTVQYFRNPVDLADSIATLSELMDGRELSIGLGRGNPGTALRRKPKRLTGEWAPLTVGMATPSRFAPDVATKGQSSHDTNALHEGTC